MSDQRTQDWLNRHAGLAKKRAQWATLWQSLSDIFQPTRGGFTTEILEGQEFQNNIYDASPMRYRRDLATAIHDQLKSSASRWFWMKAENEDLNDVDSVKRWFDVVGDRMWAEIYAPEARFIQQTCAVDNDIATFGLGYLWIGENRHKSGLSFRSIHINSVNIDENADGVVDTVTIERRFTARQAVQRYGADKLGPKVLEAFNSPRTTDKDKLFSFIQCIYPRDEADKRQRDSKNMPIASLEICKEDELIIEETGFHEFPIAIPRWEVIAGQVYPRSPAMLALPDARTLQSMGRTILLAGEKTVDPPIWALDDGTMSAVRTYPGGITTINAQSMVDNGGRPPIGVLEMGKQLNIGLEMQKAVQDSVGAAFFKDIFTMPVDGKQMTATEVEERKAQYLRTVAPVLSQLEPDYIGVTVERVFGIMMRAGAFPPPPKELAGQKAQFEFLSAIQRAKREMEMAGFARAMTVYAPLLQIDPEAAENLDVGQIIRDGPEAYGLREKWLRPLEEVQQRQQAKRQAIAQATALQQLGPMAQAGKAMSRTNLDLAQAEQTRGTV